MPLSPASVKLGLVLPFWYRLTRVVRDKEPVNVCACVLCYCEHVAGAVTTVLCVNCVTDSLLRNAAEFVDKLMEVDEALCIQWSCPELVLAIMEAVKQIGSVLLLLLLSIQSNPIVACTTTRVAQ